MRPSPTESATLFKIGTKKKGNDGNMYIVSTTKSNIKRWIKYNNKFILSPIKNYPKKWNIICKRNNSLLEVLSFTIDSKQLTIEFRNKIFPKTKKIMKLEKLGIDMNDTYINIGYKDKNYNYFIELDLTKSSPILFDLLNKYNKKKNYKDGMEQDDIDKTKDHHYGDLCLMTKQRIKKCKLGTKYYIVEGQVWSFDYTGEYSIRVIEYTGKWDDFDYAPFKYVGKHKNNFMGINCSSDICSTGSGSDPVHFITKWNKKFNKPKGLPNALLYK